MKTWVIRIGANYFIVPLCGIMYLTAGAVFFLFLPFLQLFFCYQNYKWSHDLKSWLLLQINMLIAAMFGNYTGARLFLSFISNDAESQIIFTFIFQVDMWIVLLLSHKLPCGDCTRQCYSKVSSLYFKSLARD